MNKLSLNTTDVWRLSLLAAITVVTVTTSGCVTGRRSIPLPISAAEPAAKALGNIYVGPIADDRVFENKPKDPSTPSIDGDVTTLTPKEKETFIGRQRNGYGHAMGDVVLVDNENVSERMKELLKKSLATKGYAISSDAASSNSAKVTIKQFWAWFTPGMFAVTFESRIEADVVFNKDGKIHEATISGHGSNTGQVASDANWQLAYSRGFDDFLVNLDKELAVAGF